MIHWNLIDIVQVPDGWYARTDDDVYGDVDAFCQSIVEGEQQLMYCLRYEEQTQRLSAYTGGINPSPQRPELLPEEPCDAGETVD